MSLAKYDPYAPHPSERREKPQRSPAESARRPAGRRDSAWDERADRERIRRSGYDDRKSAADARYEREERRRARDSFERGHLSEEREPRGGRELDSRGRPRAEDGRSRPRRPEDSGSRRPEGRSGQSNSRPPRKGVSLPSPSVLLPFFGIAVILTIMIFSLRSCFAPTQELEREGWLLEFSSQTLLVGGTGTVTLVGLPDDVQSDITWSSSDPEIVSVRDGKMTADRVGEVTISASVDGENITGTVKVIDSLQNVRSISLNQSSLTILSGNTFTLEVTVAFNDDTTLTDLPVVWTSSNNAVASVSSAGLVTARDVGTASITATIGNQSTVCDVTVQANANAAPAGDQIGVTVPEGSEVPSDPTAVTPETAVPAPEAVPEVAPTPEAAATPQTEEPAPEESTPEESTPVGDVTSIAISQNFGFLDVGGTLTLEGGAVPSTVPVTWSSSNPAVATVNADGLVTGVGPGSAVIIAQAGALSASCHLEVDGVPQNLVPPEQTTTPPAEEPIPVT